MKILLKVWLMSVVFFAASGVIQAAEVLEDLDGTPISLASLSGKWVFINYWASWCGPCVDEIAELNHFYETNPSSKVALFAVNYDGLSVSKQQRLIHKFDIHYPSLNPRSLRSLHLGDISVVPVTYVFDPSGHLSTTLYGGQTLKSLKEVLG